MRAKLRCKEPPRWVVTPTSIQANKSETDTDLQHCVPDEQLPRLIGCGASIVECQRLMKTL